MGYPNRRIQREREPVGTATCSAAVTAPGSHSECRDTPWRRAPGNVGTRIRAASETLI